MDHKQNTATPKGIKITKGIKNRQRAKKRQQTIDQAQVQTQALGFLMMILAVTTPPSHHALQEYFGYHEETVTSQLFNYAKAALYLLPKVNLRMHIYAMFNIGLETKGLQFSMKFKMYDVKTFASSKISL